MNSICSYLCPCFLTEQPPAPMELEGRGHQQHVSRIVVQALERLQHEDPDARPVTPLRPSLPPSPPQPAQPLLGFQESPARRTGHRTSSSDSVRSLFQTPFQEYPRYLGEFKASGTEGKAEALTKLKGMAQQMLGLVRVLLQPSPGQTETTDGQAAAASPDVFVSSGHLSHELRGPLSALVHTEAPSEQELEALYNVLSTKIETLPESIPGTMVRVAVEQQEFTLDKLEATLRGMSQSLADSARMRMSFSFPKQPRRFRADFTKIVEILNNFILNAIKYRKEGPEQGTIEIIVERVDNGLKFSVKDNGQGMSPESQSQVFRRTNFQAESVNTSSVESSGVGLANCDKFIRAMNQDRSPEQCRGVESEKGVGSTFWFTSPVAVVATNTQFNPPNPSILFADDAEFMCGIYRQWCGKVFKIQAPTIVNSGQEALAAWRAAKEEGKQFDVVFLDQHMADSLGTDVAKTILAESPVPPCIVIYSGDPEQELRTLLNHPAVGFLQKGESKPADVVAMVNRIRQR